MPLYEFHTAIWREKKEKEKVEAFRFTATSRADTQTWDQRSEHRGTQLELPTIHCLQP